ncbi:DMT family transporter [Methylobacterium terricola]|uniref:DMT family transporter n=1 Tax=Methylobacterium terricola TaxID=2583531 RepID=A0A5C4LKL4_9HYPH|nr:DMT family transporter [Methylobacterium terricola]
MTAATFLWSLAGLFVRLIDLPVWDLIAWRSVFAGLALLALSILRPARDATFGWVGLGASVLAAVTMAAYAASLTLTSVANVLIVYATLPFATAGLAWLLLGERSSRRIVIASAVSLTGVLAVAGQSMRVDDVAGNGLAVVMTVAFAGLLILARRFERIDLVRVNAVAAFWCVLVALPLSSGPVPGLTTLALLAALGILTTALSFLLFLLGSRHIPSTEAALIGLLDVVLGPLWVWIVMSEDPSPGALLGGVIVLAAVVWYLAPTLRERPKGRAPGRAHPSSGDATPSTRHPRERCRAPAARP